MIEETDWNSILSDSDVNKAAEQWSDRFLSIMEECIPCQYLQKKWNLPWLTKNIMQLIRKRKSLFRKAKRSSGKSYFDQYKK